MAIDHDKVMEIAEAYTAAWNSGSPAAVAEFYAQDGRIVINRGEPWAGRPGIAELPPASSPMFRTSRWFATMCAARAIMSYISGPLRAPIPGPRTPCALSDGRNGISMGISR